MSNRTKPKSKISHIEAHDECGNLVFFEMPFAAMYMNTGQVSCADEMRIERVTIDRLMRGYFKEVDRSDVLIHDLDDKIKVVNRLERKGGWI
jgi:hypothetical protein